MTEERFRTDDPILRVILATTDRWLEGPLAWSRCEELADAINAYLAERPTP